MRRHIAIRVAGSESLASSSVSLESRYLVEASAPEFEAATGPFGTSPELEDIAAQFSASHRGRRYDGHANVHGSPRGGNRLVSELIWEVESISFRNEVQLHDVSPPLRRPPLGAHTVRSWQRCVHEFVCADAGPRRNGRSRSQFDDPTARFDLTPAQLRARNLGSRNDAKHPAPSHKQDVKVRL